MIRTRTGRARAVIAGCGAVVAGLSLVAVTTAPAGAIGGASAPALCDPSAVHLAATMNRASYSPGQPVVMRSSIKNVSQQPCSVWLGLDPGFSPSFVVVNAKDREVWDACRVDDQPGACFDILVAHGLRPGQSYHAKVTWDQGSGTGSKPPRRVRPGTYTFGTHYQYIAGTATAQFTIVGAGGQ